MSESLPEVAFLGFAERATQVRDAETQVLKWNVLGLKPILLAPFFPFPLNGLHVALALRISYADGGLKIKFKAESGDEIGWFNLQLTAAVPEVPLVQRDSPFVWHSSQGWLVLFIMLPGDPQIMILQPGLCSVTLETSNKSEQIIGDFYCSLIEPAPLTPERIAAIKSNPAATKAVRAIYGCNDCPTKCRVYAALEPSPQLEGEGFVWFQYIPEQFVCECGKTRIDLRTVKRNFFALLGSRHEFSGRISYASLYETSAIENLSVELINLLNADPLEEVLQKFIEKNPIILHQFPAERLFFKTQILTQFKSDFAIVTPQKELVLIELERASTRLLKRDGGQHAALTHAIDQINRWLRVTSDHLLAVLDDALHVPRDMVSKVRGVVIAGRDAGNDASDLRRLKGSDQGAVTVLTYDDLAASLKALAQRMENL